MLRIECTQKAGVCYPLLADHIYVVGRKQGEITFPDDQSVSRVHAQLEVQHPAGNITEPHLIPVLSITDSGSKFGTFASEVNINEKIQVNPRESITLPIGEKLRFGLQWNEFRVTYTPLVATTSSMKASAEFKSKIVKLGGHLINEWDGNVTHVVMESVTLTVKVVCALLAAKPIVTPAYIADLLDSFITKKAQPNPKDFLPPVKEREIAGLRESNFHPNPARTTLFGGKFFLFCTSKHLKKLSSAILAGGGTADLITKYVESEVSVAGNEYIIMGQPVEIAVGEKDEKIKIILETYKRSGKRYIGDSEIGLAAVHNSIEKFCNPKFNMGNAVLPNLATQSQLSSISNVTIVPATQDIDTQRSSEGNNGTRNVVNETVVEVQNDDDDDDIVETYSSSSRAAKRHVPPEATSTKKRSAAETLTGPGSKRLKEKEVPSKQTQSPLSRSTRSQIKNSSRVLTSRLFNLSDSDDDDETKNDAPLVAETQQETHEAVPSDDDGTNVVLDSQPHESEPLVRVVAVSNLQSLRSTQSSVTSVSTNRRRSGVDEVEAVDDVMSVPDSPPGTLEALEAVENDRAIRNPGTDFIDTITTSVMNAKTIVLPRSPPKKPNGEQPSTSRADSTRKRRREPEPEEEEKTLADKTKKMNLTDLKEIVKAEADGVQCITRPLLNKSLLNRVHESILGSNEAPNGGSSKNFKTFKKVLPKFMCPSRDGSGQENASGRSGTSVLNASVVSVRNTKIVKLIPKDYDPGHSKFYGYEESRPPPLVEVRLRGEDADTPPGFHDLDSLLDFDPTPVATRRTGRRNNKEPTATASTSSKSKEPPVPVPSSSTQNSNPVTSQQQRTSPRKKGSSKNEAALMPPPPKPVPKKAKAPVFVPMEEDDEDEEDDMWSFDR